MGTPFAAGQVLAGRYKLEQPLGRGGMGSVWRASHVITRRSVALKLLQPSFELRQDMRQRLLREARAAASVGHPCVVEVFDVVELADGAPLLVMEYLEGETLGALLQRESPLSLERALSLLLPVIAAVGTAHRRGIVHRDLKPDNVFLQKRGDRVEPKVLDFGIAKLLGDDLALDQAPLTGTGVVLGTPCYMAPEQSFGERGVDARADIWSLGAILYEALSGRKPVEGENLGQVILSFLTQNVPPLAALAPELPPDVSALVMRMLAKEAAERPADLDSVYELLSLHHGQRSSFPGIIDRPAESKAPVEQGAPAAALAPTSLADPKPVRDTSSGGVQTVSIVSRPRGSWLALGSAAALLALGGGAVLVWRASSLAVPPPGVAASIPLPQSAASPVTVSSATAPSATAGALSAAPAPSTLPSARHVSVRSKPASVSAREPAPPPLPSFETRPPSPEAPAAPPPPRREGLQEEPPF